MALSAVPERFLSALTALGNFRSGEKAPIRYWLRGLPAGAGAGAVSSNPDSNALLCFLCRFGASKATAGFAGAEIQSASAPVAAKAEEKGVRLASLLSQQGKSLKRVFLDKI